MDISRLLIGLGLALLLAGLVWPVLAKLGLGRLPGDITIRRDGFSFYQALPSDRGTTRLPRDMRLTFPSASPVVERQRLKAVSNVHPAARVTNACKSPVLTPSSPAIPCLPRRRSRVTTSEKPVLLAVEDVLENQLYENAHRASPKRREILAFQFSKCFLENFSRNGRTGMGFENPAPGWFINRTRLSDRTSF